MPVANILITELFDTELIGEGALPSYEHAHRAPRAGGGLTASLGQIGVHLYSLLLSLHNTWQPQPQHLCIPQGTLIPTRFWFSVMTSSLNAES